MTYSWDGIVIIMTRLQAVILRNPGLSFGRVEIFLISKAWLCRPTQLSVEWVPGALTLGVNQLVHEGDFTSI